MILLVLLIASPYTLLLLALIRGNRKLRSSVLPLQRGNLSITVIVPYRDEIENLPLLLNSLFQQDYPVDSCELLFVNDHSVDGSQEYLSERIKDSPFAMKLLALDEKSGKKEAIRLAVQSAAAEVIICTDADCSMGRNWMSSVSNYFEYEDCDFLMAAVRIRGVAGLSLQQTEFSALIASTSGAVGIDKPFLCNGANLAFKASVFKKVKPYKGNSQLASGDDVFFLHSIKKEMPAAKIRFNTSPEAVVETQGISSLSAFINQRSRWARKSIYYKDADSQWIGGILLAMNLLLLILLFSSHWALLLLVFLLKWALDTALLQSAKQWLMLSNIRNNSLLLSLLYPFYFFSFAFLSLLHKPLWKGRKV